MERTSEAFWRPVRSVVKATSLMFEANLKKVTGAMFNIFAQNLTQETKDKIHAERKRKKDQGDPKRDQWKMREKQCRSER